MKIYLVQLIWVTEEERGSDVRVYKNRNDALDKYNSFIEDENDADISWVGSEVYDENGDVNDGYTVETSEGTEGNLFYNVTDNSTRFTRIELLELELE